MITVLYKLPQFPNNFCVSKERRLKFSVLFFTYVLDIVPLTNCWKFPGKELLIGLYLSYTVIVLLNIDHNGELIDVKSLEIINAS